MAKRVLVADDDENIRELILVTLEDEGFEVFSAKDGNEAVAKAKQVKPDLVILDVMMPGKVGYQVCEEIRKDPATKKAYVIFLSARGTSVAETAGKDSGGDEFMVKPFDPKTLREKVKQILGQKS